MDKDTVINDQEVKDVVLSLFVVGKSLKSILNDGKVTVTDLPALLALKSPVTVFSSKLALARQQLGSLNKEEIQDLVSFVGSQLGVQTDVQDFVEKVTKGLDALAAIREFNDCFKK